MSRQDITDKGSTQPKSEWFGFKYRVTPESSKLLQEAVFKDGGGWGYSRGKNVAHTDQPFLIVRYGEITYSNDEHYFENCVYLPEKQPPQPERVFKVGKWYKCVDATTGTHALTEGNYYKCTWVSPDSTSIGVDSNTMKDSRGWMINRFDINSESDYDPNTAHGKFVEDLKAAFPPFDKVVDTEIQKSKIDVVATGYTKLYRAEDVTVSIGGVSLEEVLKCPEFSGSYAAQIAKLESHIHLGNKSGNNATTNVGDVNMSTTQRKVVEVQLFDDAKGLPVQDSLVAKFDNVLTEDDNDTTIREVIMNNDIKKVLAAHNVKRAKVINQDILERTGNSVTLQPVLLKDLRWKVIG